jgi:hypothetical protein
MGKEIPRLDLSFLSSAAILSGLIKEKASREEENI